MSTKKRTAPWWHDGDETESDDDEHPSAKRPRVRFTFRDRFNQLEANKKSCEAMIQTTLKDSLIQELVSIVISFEESTIMLALKAEKKARKVFPSDPFETHGIFNKQHFWSDAPKADIAWMVKQVCTHILPVEEFKLKYQRAYCIDPYAVNITMLINNLDNPVAHADYLPGNFIDAMVHPLCRPWQEDTPNSVHLSVCLEYLVGTQREESEDRISIVNDRNYRLTSVKYIDWTDRLVILALAYNRRDILEHLIHENDIVIADEFGHKGMCLWGSHLHAYLKHDPTLNAQTLPAWFFSEHAKWFFGKIEAQQTILDQTK